MFFFYLRCQGKDPLDKYKNYLWIIWEHYTFNVVSLKIMSILFLREKKNLKTQICAKEKM